MCQSLLAGNDFLLVRTIPASKTCTFILLFLLRDAGYHICPIDHIKHFQLIGYKNLFFCTDCNSLLFPLCLTFNKVINMSLSPRERPDVEVKLSCTVQREERWLRGREGQTHVGSAVWPPWIGTWALHLLWVPFSAAQRTRAVTGAAAKEMERSQVTTTQGIESPSEKGNA